MLNRLRWWIVCGLAKSKSICWADLVMWATMERGLAELLDLHGTLGQCERGGELPYCGKCRQGE